MKEKNMSFEEYFKAIGIKEPIQKRIEYIYAKIQKIFPETKFDDVSINEYVDSNNERQFESIRFYSKDGMIVKAHNFLVEEYFAVSHYSKQLDAIVLKTKNYDLEKANADSRINVTGTWGAGASVGNFIDLKGTAENCDYLFAIYKKYFLNRLRKDGYLK